MMIRIAAAIVLAATQLTTRQMVLRDRTGREIAKVGEAAPMVHEVEIAPDDKTAVIVKGGYANAEIWLMDLASGRERRFAFGRKATLSPVWSADGRRIAFSSNRAGHLDIYVKSVNAGNDERLLFASDRNKWPKSWSPDGRFLSFVDLDPSGKTAAGNAKTELWILPLLPLGKPSPYFTSEAYEDTCIFSPDGRWMAYISDETGRLELFVSTFPKSAAKWQISTAGLPAFPPAFRWRRDGKEILYVSSDWTMMSVAVKSGDTFEASKPRPLFKIEPDAGFDVTRDGSRFLMAEPVRQ